MRYQPTIIVSSISNFEGIKPGQWVQYKPTRSRGQFLGHTKTGAVVIRWQNGKFCQVNKNDVFNNKWLRKFALSSKA